MTMSLNKINSTLYIVATPIGNLEDITFRAIRVLREADLILCEDTRVTKKLLAKYEISARVESYHAHTKITKAERFFNMRAEGKNIALVSDAGTPAISDPGVLLVKMARARFGHDSQIVPIPGPSALTTAISAGDSRGAIHILGIFTAQKGEGDGVSPHCRFFRSNYFLRIPASHHENAPRAREKSSA